MKRRIIFVLAVLLILVGLFILVKVMAENIIPKGRGALQVSANIKSAVFLDNKPIGDTNLCLCEQGQTLDVGEYDLRIVPEDQSLQPFTTRVRINNNVLTAVERTFLPGALSSTYTLILEKVKDPEPQLFIASIPEGALITVNGEPKGVTPLLLDKVSESEHEVEIQKQGFSKKTIKVRTIKSHKLVLNTILGTDTGDELVNTPNITPTDEEISPTPSPLPDNSVVITNTPTGFLRVRATSSTASTEIGRVNPGENYLLLDEITGWYQIELENGEAGWISSTYANKTSP